MEAAILSLVREGTSGWEHLVPSTVRLGLTLLCCVPVVPGRVGVPAAAAGPAPGQTAARAVSSAPLDAATGLQVGV
jgi:hypothetical protein